jgi:hypothetical protein
VTDTKRGVQTSAQIPPPESSPADQLVDAWLIDHFGIASPQFLTLAAKEDLKSRIRAALKEG